MPVTAVYFSGWCHCVLWKVPECFVLLIDVGTIQEMGLWFLLFFCVHGNGEERSRCQVIPCNFFTDWSVCVGLCYLGLYYIWSLNQWLGARLDCRNSIANALELLQSCTKPSICEIVLKMIEFTVHRQQTPSGQCCPYVRLVCLTLGQRQPNQSCS